MTFRVLAAASLIATALGVHSSAHSAPASHSDTRAARLWIEQLASRAQQHHCLGPDFSVCGYEPDLEEPVASAPCKYITSLKQLIGTYSNNGFADDVIASAMLSLPHASYLDWAKHVASRFVEQPGSGVTQRFLEDVLFPVRNGHPDWYFEYDSPEVRAFYETLRDSQEFQRRLDPEHRRTFALYSAGFLSGDFARGNIEMSEKHNQFDIDRHLAGVCVDTTPANYLLHPDALTRAGERQR